MEDCCGPDRFLLIFAQSKGFNIQVNCKIYITVTAVNVVFDLQMSFPILLKLLSTTLLIPFRNGTDPS